MSLTNLGVEGYWSEERLDGKKGEKEGTRGGVRECVFRCGIRQDGLPHPIGNLSLSERERERESGKRGKERGKRKDGTEDLGKDR